MRKVPGATALSTEQLARPVVRAAGRSPGDQEQARRLVPGRWWAEDGSVAGHLPGRGDHAGLDLVSRDFGCFT